MLRNATSAAPNQTAGHTPEARRARDGAAGSPTHAGAPRSLRGEAGVTNVGTTET